MASKSEEHPLSRIHTPRSYFEPLPLGSLFAAEQALEVEIGCGNGSFLVKYAAAQTERNFLGIERLLGRVRKLDRKAIRLGLTNLSIVRVEASYGIQYFLPPESVSVYHIYFPDPWPKRKHWKNRLVAPEFLPLLKKSLIKKGKVYLRTDNREYFEQMLETFAGDSSFHPIDAPESLTEIITDFERGFNAEGIPTLYCQYELTQ